MMDDYTIIRENEIKKINEKYENRVQRGYRRDKWYVSLLTQMEDTSPLSEHEIKEIEDFWKPYEFAYKNDPIVQWGYSRQLGRFDPSIMGLGCLMFGLEYFHSHPTWPMCKNKCFLQNIFSVGDIRHPKRIVAKDYGIYIDVNGHIVSESEAVDIVIEELKSENELIIKPSAETAGCGVGVTVLTNGVSKEEVLKTFKSLGNNFICSEKIVQHKSFAKPNASSLNTLRVVTISWEGKVYLSGCMFRMGMPGSIIDSWSQGGVICSVDENGICSSEGLYENGKRTDRHPSGFKFGGYKLKNADLAQKTAVHLHESLPHLHYISWDLSVDQNGKIVLIEVNQCGGADHFSAFGINIFRNRETTKDILDKYLFRITANMDWNYREYRDHIVLTSYEGNKTTVNVPTMINDKRVQLCWNDAFLNKNVKEIHLPNDIEFDRKGFSKKYPDAQLIIE